MNVYKSVFNSPVGPITSVVLDKDDFNEMVRGLVGVLNASAHLTSADECALQHIIDAEVLPGMQRGSKTQYVFDRFGIETDFAAFIVRGAGAKVLKQELGV